MGTDLTGEHDEPLPTLEGRALCFGLELTAHQMLDTSHARLVAEDARHYLFAAIDPGLAARLTFNDVVVAEHMSGATDSAGPALAALAAANVNILVARRFAPAFRGAAADHGVVTLLVDAPSFLHTGDRLRVDLDAAKVVNLSSGDRAAIHDLDDDAREAVRRMVTSRSARR